MAKSKTFSKEVNFDDDVMKDNKIHDVYDLVKFIRNAMCHIDSQNHSDEECNARITYNVIYGKGVFLVLGGKEFPSDYEDDVCFFFGSQKLYLRRHLIRAYKEARLSLEAAMT